MTEGVDAIEDTFQVAQVGAFQLVLLQGYGAALKLGTSKKESMENVSGKQLRVYTSSHKCHSHVWRVDTATGKTIKKNRMRVKTSADRRLKIKLRV